MDGVNNFHRNEEVLNSVANGNTIAWIKDKEEDCQKELIGTGRYGCRCQQCCEDIFNGQEDNDA